ncbi:MAG TPA: polysaccharide biosynthesis/export family protein [Verrucomicrobiae bacterium]|nr:polysaccharide biosynthesis/export family protein [Verrucomicrobiae bacterium]
MRRFILIASVVAVGFFPCAVVAQNATPPKELVQYVRDAHKAGIKDDQIQKNAVLAGWPENLVKAALLAGGTPSNETTRNPDAAPEGAPSTAAPERSSSGDSPAAKPSGTAQPSFELSAGRDAGTNSGNTKPPTGETATTPAAATPGEAGTNNGKTQPLPGDPAGPAATPAAGAPPKGDSAGAPTPVIVRKPDRGASEDYVIGAGDVLSIVVWREPEASIPSVVVRTDGKITVPLIKDVAVDGLTLRQAEDLITDKLNSFLTAPDVTVGVKEQTSKKIYVIGAVKREGAIPFTFNMNVLQALSEAGGLTDYAKRKRIYVLRKEEGREFQLRFDYDAALKGQHMELNIQLRAGDTIVVPH